MTRSAHPSLRRLWALGGAPTACVTRLEGPLPALGRLCHDLDDLELVSNAVIEPLLREVDLAALLHGATERQSQPAPHEAERGRAERIGLEPLAAARAQRLVGRPEAERPSGRIGYEPPAVIAPSGRHRDARAASRTTTLPHSRGSGDAGPAPHMNDRAAWLTPRAHRLIAARSRADAMEALRHRALRAGSPAALHTPVAATPAPNAVTAILELIERTPDNQRRGDDGALGSSSDSHPVRTSAAAIPGASQLAQVLGRIESTWRRRSRTSREASSPQASVRRAPQSDRAADRLFEPSAEAPRLGGLRGLAAQSSPMHGSSAGPLLSERGEPERSHPPLVAERVREAELAERIDRLLRREACGYGIDVEEIET